MLNQNPPDLGIPNRFRLNSYRSKGRADARFALDVNRAAHDAAEAEVRQSNRPKPYQIDRSYIVALARQIVIDRYYDLSETHIVLFLSYL
jgi:hypothetical protein